MKKIKITFTLLAIVYLAMSQPNQKPTSSTTPKPAGVITQSKLKTSQAGLPIEMGVLRYNDSLLLALQPNEVNSTYVFFEPKNDGLDFLNHHVFTLYFPKDMVKPDEVIELVSIYGFTLKDGMLSKPLSQQAIEYKQQKLPPYLSFSVEEIRVR